MHFGNQFWKARTKHGRDKLFKTPAILEEAVKEYFEHASQDFLIEAKPHAYEGEITYSENKKMVPFTIGRLCLFLNISDETWRDYRSKHDYSGVCAWAEKIIYEQKYAGAAAGLLNHAIIARDLGLMDTQRVDHTSSDGSMTPNTTLDTSKLTTEQLKAIKEAVKKSE